jgi:hypothetical protein
MASEDANGPYFGWISGNLFLEHLESSRDPITREGLREYIESQNNDSNTYFSAFVTKAAVY